MKYIQQNDYAADWKTSPISPIFAWLTET